MDQEAQGLLVIGDLEKLGFLLQGSSVAEWPHGEEVPYWLGQQALETESVPKDKHWSSQLSPNLDSKHLCRTSSYPEQ
ncbi:hypothetical protein GOBAR_DD19988 [Gossypium barbadense]|nr:hypothetical protein GOBAR_DD19988 [Gossypium barbadense]